MCITFFIEKWDRVNLVRFNKAKGKELHLGWGDPRREYRLGEELIERSPVEKELGIVMDKKMNVSQQCVLAV